MSDNNRVFVPRWGDASLDDKDYVTIPGLILRNCAKAGVEPEELAFIAQVMSFKYDVPNAAARPSVASIADRLGVSRDTARRYKSSLIDKGLMEFEPQCDDKGYSIAPDILTFAGLVQKCRELDTPLLQNCNTPSGNSASPPLAELQDEDLEDKTKNPKNERSKDSEPPKNGGSGVSTAEKAEQPHIALITAYFNGLPGGKPMGQTIKRYVAPASQAVKDGATPEDILAFMDVVYRTDNPTYKYWHDRLLPFGNMLELLGIWKAKNAPREIPLTDYGHIVPPGEDYEELLRMAETEAIKQGWNT